jgi:hypothetical protein
VARQTSILPLSYTSKTNINQAINSTVIDLGEISTKIMRKQTIPESAALARTDDKSPCSSSLRKRPLEKRDQNY